jgi:two-component system chemotaxis response regulator CheY
MKVLIVEDDFISRKLLQDVLGHYGECDVAVDGVESVEAFKVALESNNPYELVCMDIMLPRMDGQQALKEIRKLEKENNVEVKDEVKVLMITALGDPKNVMESLYRGGANSYIVKPVDTKKLIEEIRKLGLLDL